ncbi:MAG: 30S ribosome-binding factor RbfA [Chloroflexi bacterium]|nr:MAG: 30S ribosome-binding factor RbfA [Chloroflexota bacterium]
MSKIRQQRTAHQIQMILSELCQRELRDPRLQLLTITEVTIDRELQYADVYVNALGDESRRDEVMAALKKATGFFRREVAHRLRLRTAPQLIFHWDPTLAQAERVHQILNSLEIPPVDEEE